MTTVVHHCGWQTPHGPHASLVPHLHTPSLVTILSCPGTIRKATP